MADMLKLIWWAVIGLFRSRASLGAEILTLRHQLNVLRRNSPKRLSTMRNITHALRGWPLPIGVGINALRCTFDEDCKPSDAHVDGQLRIMAEQAVGFTQMISGPRHSPSGIMYR